MLCRYPLTQQEKEEWGVDSTITCGPKREREGMWWEM